MRHHRPQQTFWHTHTDAHTHTHTYTHTHTHRAILPYIPKSITRSVYLLIISRSCLSNRSGPIRYGSETQAPITEKPLRFQVKSWERWMHSVWGKLTGLTANPQHSVISSNLLKPAPLKHRLTWASPSHQHMSRAAGETTDGETTDR